MYNLSLKSTSWPSNQLFHYSWFYIEGFFGATTITLFMVVLNFISKSIQSPEEFARSPFNIVEAFSQVFGNRTVLVTSLLIMASIASFNFVDCL